MKTAVMQVYNNDRTRSTLDWVSKWESFKRLINDELNMLSSSVSTIDDDDANFAVVVSEDVIFIATNIRGVMIT